MIFTKLKEMLRLMIGVPDYQRYLAHRRRAHPQQTVLSEPEFIAELQIARYGGCGARCC